MVDIIASFSRGEHIWRDSKSNPNGKEIADLCINTQNKLVEHFKKEQDKLVGDMINKINAFVNEDTISYSSEIWDMVRQQIFKETLQKGFDESFVKSKMNSSEVNQLVDKIVNEMLEKRKHELITDVTQ